jgi:hypothetical protein
MRRLICLFAVSLLAACSGSTDSFLGTWTKASGNYYFNGALSAVTITKENGNLFVQVICSCDARGKFLAAPADGKLKFSVPFQGDGYVAWIENGKRLNVLGDEFVKAGNAP